MRQLAGACVLCFLLAACGGGGGGSSSSGTGGPTVVSGKVTFDFVPVALTGALARLDYDHTARRPARSVVVEVVDAGTQSILATASTNAAGDYTFTLAAGRTVFIRAKATMKAIGGNTADISVIDNTSAGAQWAIDGAPFATGVSPALTQNLNAASGWNGSAYIDAERAAGPFAILDTIYQAAQKIISVDPAISFPKLTVNWSPNNVASNGDVALGQIGTSFYQRSTSGNTVLRNLYFLGFADNDTDEYDTHVVAHELGHYLQEAFARDDLVGGLHGGPDDPLDLRVAFSEGWSNGWSGIALNNPIYSDTIGPSQASGGSFNVSVGESTNPGWFKEHSVEKMFWDFSNHASIGFSQVWSTLKTGLKVSAALSSIHSFARALANDTSNNTLVASILATQSIALPTTPYADNETNFGNPVIANINPIYLTYGSLNTVLANVCVGNAADPYLDANKAGEYRHVRLTLPAGNRTVVVAQSSSTTNVSDPDFVLYNSAGRLLEANGTVSNSETANWNLPAGDYVLAITDFRLFRPTSSGGNTSACFSLTVQ